MSRKAVDLTLSSPIKIKELNNMSARLMAILWLTSQTTNIECAMPIRHNNLKNNTTLPWKANDNYLDWYGIEQGQSSKAQGTAMDWTTNIWPSEYGSNYFVETNRIEEGVIAIPSLSRLRIVEV